MFGPCYLTDFAFFLASISSTPETFPFDIFFFIFFSNLNFFSIYPTNMYYSLIPSHKHRWFWQIFFLSFFPIFFFFRIFRNYKLISIFVRGDNYTSFRRWSLSSSSHNEENLRESVIYQVLRCEADYHVNSAAGRRERRGSSYSSKVAYHQCLHPIFSQVSIFQLQNRIYPLLGFIESSFFHSFSM